MASLKEIGREIVNRIAGWEVIPDPNKAKEEPFNPAPDVINETNRLWTEAEISAKWAELDRQDQELDRRILGAIMPRNIPEGCMAVYDRRTGQWTVELDDR